MTLSQPRSLVTDTANRQTATAPSWLTSDGVEYRPRVDGQLSTRERGPKRRIEVDVAPSWIDDDGNGCNPVQQHRARPWPAPPFPTKARTPPSHPYARHWRTVGVSPVVRKLTTRERPQWKPSKPEGLPRVPRQPGEEELVGRLVDEWCAGNGAPYMPALSFIPLAVYQDKAFKNAHAALGCALEEARFVGRADCVAEEATAMIQRARAALPKQMRPRTEVRRRVGEQQVFTVVHRGTFSLGRVAHVTFEPEFVVSDVTSTPVFAVTMEPVSVKIVVA
jgi:hypothetical protein